MENIWAPWRGEYIKGPLNTETSKCVFCELSKNKPHKDNLIVHKTEFGFVLMNKYPYNNAHVMVIPNKHADCFQVLSEKEYVALCDLLKLSVKVIKHVYQPQGINIGMNLGKAAGAGLDSHIHHHVVPRWNGDTNFMPVLAETKIISEHLFETYERLIKGFKEVVR